ncbi:MAG: ABC transporter permease subunit [Proteobacteria bacterium]|nr:ABC transporter permease subunit [Pseudomonadota bacterium]
MSAAMRRLRPYRLIAGLAAMFGVLMFWPLVNGINPSAIDLYSLMQPPQGANWLGTDELGRDVLTRLGLGMRLSVFVGLAVVCVCATVGTAIGMVSGYMGGWVDNLLMRLTDVFLSFPGILMAIAFAALAGPGVGNVVLALCLMGWVGFARLARAQSLSLREADFVRAAELSGIGFWRILAVYILPNIAAPLIVECSFSMAGAMLAEAGLSFLGIGVQPPSPSLGAMLREGARYMLVAPHMVMAPGFALMGLVLMMNALGDKLRDRMDVRA